jgi:choline dehydrogenase-like flavoprotein
MRTYLQDAQDHGAQILVRTFALKVVTEGGRAAGVLAVHTDPETGETANVTVHAPHVVVAAGALESPALLLRSEIGGPAAGKNLRLHPAFLVMGVYDEPVEGWNGQIQSALSDHFLDVEDGCGFLIEATGVQPGLLSASMPWESGAQHKELMSTLRWQAPFITVARDHGSGEVVLDEHGRAVVRWDFEDEVDARLARVANVELARLHHAAGAERIFTLHSAPLMWSRGDDFDGYLGQVEGASYAPNDIACFTAHQMGSCRMGSDPQTSVADGRGQLHDTQGVWIGDASAFPTAPGVNPMVTIMSLAHRTADAILA